MNLVLGSGNLLIMMLLLALVYLIICIRNIVKFKEYAIFLSLACTLLPVMVYRMWGHWGKTSDEFVIMIFVGVIILAFVLPHLRIPPRLQAAFLIFLLSVWGIFEFKWKKDLELYVYFHGLSDYPQYNLYDWASSTEEQDWTAIFKKYPDRMLLLEALNINFGSASLHEPNAIYKNLSFRNATFSAWSDFNGSGTDPIGFGIKNEARSSILQGDVFVMADVSFNEDFVLWWMDKSAKDRRHVALMEEFFGAVMAALEYGITDEYHTKDKFADVLDTYKKRAIEGSLSGIEDSIINITQRMEGDDKPVAPPAE